MWRARSDGDEQPSNGREPRTGEGARPEGRRGLSDWPDTSDREDPRSELTGKKIRRIDTGAPGVSSSPTMRRRERPVGTSRPLAGSDQDPTQEDTQLGGPPSTRPGRHIGHPPALAGRTAPGADTDTDTGLAGLGDLGGLPPLRQPTGEQPVVPPMAERPADPAPAAPPSALDPDPAPRERPPVSDETATIGPADVLGFPAPNGNGNGNGSSMRAADLRAARPSSPGVFDDTVEATALTDLAGLIDPAGPPEPSVPVEPAPPIASPPPREPSMPPEPSDRSAGDELDELSETVRAELAAMPSVFDTDASQPRMPAAPQTDEAAPAEPAGRTPSAAPPSAFPEAGDPPSNTAAEPGDSSPTAAFPSWSGSMADHQRTDDSTRTMGAMPRERMPRPGGGRPEAPRRPGAPDRGGHEGGLGQAGRPPSRGSSQRLQETEIKLAGRQERRPKPQEPNRLVLGLAIVLVVLAGAAVAWWLTRGDGTGEGDQTATEDTVPETTDTSVPTTDTTPAAPAADTPVLDVPELSLVGVEPGPLDPAVTYSIELLGASAGSSLQVVVDGVPQGQPDLLLPDLILPPGRHTLTVSVTNAAEAKTSTPVEVYVLGPPPAAGKIANLASIDQINEGWAEALRRYDEYRDAGHQNLQMLPITPGYWNIFVPDVGADDAAIKAYCEGFGLAVPDQCFAKSFDPATYTGPTTAAPAATPSSTTPETTVTDPTGGDSSSTTTGG